MNASTDSESSSDSSSVNLILPRDPTSLNANSSPYIRSLVNEASATPTPGLRYLPTRRPRGNDNLSVPNGNNNLSTPNGHTSPHANPSTINPPVVNSSIPQPRRVTLPPPQPRLRAIARPPLSRNGPFDTYIPDRVPTSSTAAPTSIVYEISPDDYRPPFDAYTAGAGDPNPAPRLFIPPPQFPEEIAEDEGLLPDDPPPYTMEPSLAARLAAQRCQLTEGRRLVGTAAELQSQRESMEVRYEVPVREVDVEAALSREPGSRSFRRKLEEEAGCPDRMTRARTAKDKRDEFEHRKTMLRAAARDLDRRAKKEEVKNGARERSMNETMEEVQNSDEPKHMKFAQCPEGHSCELCKEGVESTESLKTRDSLETVRE